MPGFLPHEGVLHGKWSWDAHCGIFTPHSFAGLCLELAKVDLLDFSCKNFHVTECNQFEFFSAHLTNRPTDRKSSGAGVG
jgi:hypothetical protein